MSLRLRIVAAIVVVLALGSGLGLALAGLHARVWLRAELTSALTSGALTVTRDYPDLRRAADPAGELRALVASFDGSRHLRAILVAPSGAVLARSQPAPAPPPPTWFAALLRERIPAQRLPLPVPGGQAMVLDPVFEDDVAAVWAEFLDLAAVLGLSCAAGGGLVFWVVGQAVRPLATVGEVLPRIGAGDYAARAPESGPPELARLSRGVNEMAERLGAMRARNRALEMQILTLQDEERADIARDLHDEIGPQLFAANVDAAMTATLIAAGRPDEALVQVRAIQAAVAHIQRLVRDILGRLRPTPLVELGFSAAILDLVEFWRRRRPDIGFEAELPEGEPRLSEALQETVYRLTQESLANAVRHGAPTMICIRMSVDDRGLEAQVINDGPPAHGGTPGYGLSGMAERVAAAGGTLQAGPLEGGGWRVLACLPTGAATRERAA